MQWGPGVPQGSVIGPTLFLLYINDIQDNIQSPMKLFADDCAIYREICKEDDHQALQRDLQYLSTWSSDWLMNFNIKKCAILSISRKRKSRIHEYQLLNEVIPRVNQYKYIGVTITSDLRWDKHCQTIRDKASRTLGLLRRTLPSCSKEVKAMPGFILHLFAPSWNMVQNSEAWNPHNITTVNGLEQIQKAAARLYAVITGTPLPPRPLYPHLHFVNGIASTLGGYLHSAPYSTNSRINL